jgi:hypothetical protein
MPKRLLVGLHIAAAAPDAIFELAPGRVECVAQRHLKVSVLGVRARLARDGDLLAGQGQVDVHFVKVAVFVVLCRAARGMVARNSYLKCGKSGPSGIDRRQPDD